MLRMTRRVLVALFILVAAAAAAIAQGPQGQRGQGAPGARPGSGREPEFPIPNIREYKPESTLVVPQHPVPKAKYPAIDFHGHPQGLIGSSEGLERLGTALDSLNVRLMVVANNMSGDELRRSIAAMLRRR